MRKILLLMVLLLPLSLFGKNNDNEKVVMKIPLELESEDNFNRSLVSSDIECCYYGVINTIITNTKCDLGYVAVLITNYSTGEVWYDTIDCSVQQQIITQISGTPGVYEIIYMIASGDVYRGLFEIS